MRRRTVSGRWRVQHPRPLERGDLVRGPAAPAPPASREPARRTDEELEAPRARSEQGPELREVAERARADVVLDEVTDRDGVPAVGPAPEAKAGGVHRRALASSHRVGSAHRRADGELRQVEAEVRGEVRGPRAAREHHRLRTGPPPLRVDRGDPSRLRLDGAHGAVLDDGRAEPAGRAGERRHRDERLRPAVARGEDSSRPPAIQIGGERLDFLRGQETRIELVARRHLAPFLPAGHLVGAGGDVEASACGESEVTLSGLLGESPPDPVRLHDDRELRGVPPLLPNPSPVPARLLPGHPPLLEHRDPDAALGEEVGGRDAHHAGSDHEHVHRVGQRVGERNRRCLRDHWHCHFPRISSLSPTAHPSQCSGPSRQRRRPRRGVREAPSAGGRAARSIESDG